MNAHETYKNAKQNSDKQNARVEHDNAQERAVVSMMNDDTELFKQFMDNPSFRAWLAERVFEETYDGAAAQVSLLRRARGVIIANV